MKQALKNAGIQLSETAVLRLEKYLALLIEWNKQMDLTSVPEAEMAERHFADSLLPLFQEGLFPEGCRVIDVGTPHGRRKTWTV